LFSTRRCAWPTGWLLSAGADDGILSTFTPSGDHRELTVQQRFPRINSQTDRAQQRGQSVDGPVRSLTICSRATTSTRAPLATATARCRRQDRACDKNRIQGISLTDTATLRSWIRRRLGNQQSAWRSRPRSSGQIRKRHPHGPDDSGVTPNRDGDTDPVSQHRASRVQTLQAIQSVQ
jgi:hypothetical protein